MISLASLLNPLPPGPAAGSHLRSPPGSSSPEFTFLGSSSVPTRPPMNESQKMPKDIPGFSKSKVKGTVKFYPFEDLDEESLREVRRFRVTPFGSIRNNCRHIPYNSGKKDFFEKTGRESFEVFQYTFRLPNDEIEYTVMWDYNVGLVRMTPFFKCCNYPKTTPAKMLNMNPGLRDITHSITGGSIMAQGYWMPFSCAKAVCATFCHHIAGALIPIFGPQFPSDCVHPDTPDHGRMCIDPVVVAEATLEADGFRRLYAEQASLVAPLSPRQSHPRRHNNSQDRIHRPYNSSSPYQSRQHFRGRDLPDSPYNTDTEEYDRFSGPETALRHADLYRSGQSRYTHTPVPTSRGGQTAASTSTGWTPSNNQNQHTRYRPTDRHVFHGEQPRDQQHDHANPFLSALPRLPEHTPQSSPSQPRHYLPAVQPRHCNAPAAQLLLAGSQYITSAAPPTPVMSPKRPRAAFESTDTDLECDGGECHVGSSPATSCARHGLRDGEGAYHLYRHQHSRSDLQLPPIGVSVTATVAERNAALLLMNLSIPEGRDSINTADGSEKQTEKKAGGSLPGVTLFNQVLTGFKPSHDDRPAKKQRRTISI
ncbi:hypothetical protein CONLIGDRAFT_233262 [Coniochaeta ligniaria NRRL 30616]|uniref:HTH APSES-type domain-containing protein n=1 Tax=Coniochaeta ligniaria NRRL 30616 TaxID=1408157 RepID=A0A1J7IWE2_9PEZI|nr:hypothetical protein CONLIGDRAFT_233262 [Coniochaeta ligniaria NRRL 30616]